MTRPRPIDDDAPPATNFNRAPKPCPDCGGKVEYRSGLVQLNTPSAHDPMQPGERVEWFYGCVDCDFTQEIEGSDRGED